ncbi:MAG: hypothetical protein KY397_01550 [Gemmatimonadetes bacterium]|nr:hypothetical protein [Gemmatimonadota bacterium]
MTGSSPLRIAFGGSMQVGKTTAADWLVERHGFVKYALADSIKEIACRDFEWDGLKDDRGRRLLQEIGDVGRNYRPDLWLDRFAARLQADPASRAVVDDVRLEREVRYLRDLGFVVALVVRPADRIATLPLQARRSHPTETGLEGVQLDVAVDNSGSFEAFYVRLDALVKSLEVAADG